MNSLQIIIIINVNQNKIRVLINFNFLHKSSLLLLVIIENIDWSFLQYEWRLPFCLFCQVLLLVLRGLSLRNYRFYLFNWLQLIFCGRCAHCPLRAAFRCFIFVIVIFGIECNHIVTFARFLQIFLKEEARDLQIWNAIVRFVQALLGRLLIRGANLALSNH